MPWCTACNREVEVGHAHAPTAEMAERLSMRELVLAASTVVLVIDGKRIAVDPKMLAKFLL